MKIIYNLLILTAVLATGCRPSAITTSWRTKDSLPLHYNRILVMGVAQNRNANNAVLEEMESHLSGDLKDLGYNAVTATDEFTGQSFMGWDEEQITSQLNSRGIDAVLTVVLLDSKTEWKHLPRDMDYAANDYYYSSFWGYRNALQNILVKPVVSYANTQYFWESSLYNLQTKKLAWNATTKAFDEEDTNQMAHRYGRLVVKRMVKMQVLKQQIN
ncbi:hypothetical protein [Foetidibacter luteolus]|uniref:hypothetical protein n=1 Tax=Foetidibacter luteolus TaxID=2608880 RepID=UPI00129A126A|nr:hypothetical protein [Foetidibacter luteolus]